MATSIIIGMGEVGRALSQVLSTAHTVVTYDSKHELVLVAIFLSF